MAFSFVLTTMLIYVPVLRTIFGLTSITIVEYVIAISIAFVVIPVVEIVKFIQRKVG
jgi:Ca2+-transporting ATPase